MTNEAKSGCNPLVAGLFLILLGVWFLLDNMGVDLPGLWEFWPLIPIFGGGAMTLRFFASDRRDSGILVPGLGGILFGLFFFMITVGPLRWKDLDVWWPFFPTAGGLIFLAAHFFDRDHEAGVLIPGLGGFLTGIFFFLITLGPLRWKQMDDLWPVFPLIGGLAFLGTWLADRRSTGLLVVAASGLVVGVGGFLVTFGLVAASFLVDAWPIFLILGGGALVVQALVRQRRS